MTESTMAMIFLLACGGFFLALFFHITRKNILFLKQAVKTKGRVKKIVMEDSPKIMYTPVIEFRTGAQKKFVFSPPTRSSKSGYRVGREVNVVYDPDFPEDAKIKSFFQLWFPSIILFFVAALLLAAAISVPFSPAATVDTGSVPQVDKEAMAPNDPMQYFLLYWVLPGGFIFFGAITLLMGIITLLKMIASRGWPTSEGIVLESEVGTSGKYYYPRIKYEFQVNGIKYESANFDLVKGESGDPLPAKRAVKRYPAGKKVRVHYNPKKPADCALEPGIKPGSLIFFFAGGAAFLFFAWIAMVAVSNGWIE